MKNRIAAIAISTLALTAVVAPAAQASDAPHVARKARVVKSPPVVVGGVPVTEKERTVARKLEKERVFIFRKL